MRARFPLSMRTAAAAAVVVLVVFVLVSVVNLLTTK